jgi:hypothetical protein
MGAAREARADASCGKCRALAQQYRASAAQERSRTVQGSAHSPAADIEMKIAANLDAEAQKCEAGMPNKCGGSASSASGRTSPPSDPQAMLQSQLRQLGDSAVQNELLALDRAAAALDEKYQGTGGGRAAEAQALRGALGTRDLDDVGSEDEPAAQRPAPPARATAQPTPDAAPGPQDPARTAEPSGSPAAPPPVAPGEAGPGPFAPVGETPSSEEALVSGMLAAWGQGSSEPTEQAPLLGAPPGPSDPGSVFSPLDPSTLKSVETLDRAAMGAAANEVMPNVVGAANTVREQLEPFEDLHVALTDPGGAGIQAGANLIARSTEDERNRENVRNTGTLSGGALDSLNGGLSRFQTGESPEETSREEFMN